MDPRPDTSIPVRDRMQAALSTALRERDRLAVSTLRAALAAVANAGAVDASAHPSHTTEVPRRELTDADVAEVLRREVTELQGAADACRRHGRTDEADELDRRRAILAGYSAKDS